MYGKKKIYFKKLYGVNYKVKANVLTILLGVI